MTSAILAFPESQTTHIAYREVEVTPELAQRWLGLNTSNRKLKPRQIEAYAVDMAAGRWVLNAEFVKFAGPEYSPTKLLDGQNRLHAVLKAGVPVTMGVAFGVPERAQNSMDSGSKRTVGDNLTIAGMPYGTLVGAIARVAMKVRDDRMNWGTVPYTNVAVEQFISEHHELLRSAEIAGRYGVRADVSNAVVGYTHWVLAQIDPEAAFIFWRDAGEKVGLSAGDPVIAMTNWFATARRNRTQVPLPVALSIIFRAWNYRRADQTWSIVRVNSSKGGVIDIPEPC